MEEQKQLTPEERAALEKIIPGKTADAATGKIFKWKVDIMPQNWFHALLQKWKLRPTEKVFDVDFLTMGNVIRISKIVHPLELTFEDLEKMHGDVVKFMAEHENVLADIAAICLHNKKSEPSKRLVNFIKWNLTASEMFGIINLAVNRINVQGFMLTIVSVHGANILEKKIKSITETSQKIEGS